MNGRHENQKIGLLCTLLLGGATLFVTDWLRPKVAALVFVAQEPEPVAQVTTRGLFLFGFLVFFALYTIPALRLFLKGQRDKKEKEER